MTENRLEQLEQDPIITPTEPVIPEPPSDVPNDPNPYPVTDPPLEPSPSPNPNPDPFPSPPEPIPQFPPDVTF